MFEQINDYINKANKIGIAVGKTLQIDDLAGALALYLSLEKQGKNVSIASPAETLVQHSVIFGIDRVKSSFDEAAGDMTVSFPYQEGEIEKISYTLEDGFLNIIVKAGEEGLSFSEKDVVFKRSSGNPDLLFVVGTPRLSDLEKIFDPHAFKDTAVVNIDNKADNQGFGDIVLASSSFSSVSEKVADLMLSLNFPMDPDIAQNLLLGIEDATSSFQNPRTSSLAFEMAANLLKKGARRKNVEQSVRAENMPEEESSIFAPQKTPGFQEARREERRDRKNPPQDQTRNIGKPKKNPPMEWLTPKIYKGSTNI
ncbi:MAG: hypothetical protein HYT08_02600 [Candidatus Levybacteria bacterium]|nr:hypothetical protein [Candidatus Levybacteria bacterium]